jgi:prophage DNA circulation protein
VQATRGTVTELDTALERINHSGHQGAIQLESLLSKFGQTITTVQNAMRGLEGTVGLIQQTAEAFKGSASTIENSVALQRAAATDFKDALVPMNQALGRTVETLQTSAQAADSALGQVRTHMQDAQEALQGTVSAITQGVSGYTEQVADLHIKMDQHLATAVNQLGGSISNLEEVLDEFIDALPVKR